MESLAASETLDEKKWESLLDSARSRPETPPAVLESLGARRLQDRGQLEAARRRLVALRQRSSGRPEIPLLRLVEILIAQDRADAFGRSGRLQNPIFIEIHQTDDDELYRSQKAFPASRMPSGYSIPLPPGRYEVRLHVAPLTYWDLKAGFGVQCEGDIVLENVRPGEQGDGTARVERFEVSVSDGVMDLRFLKVAGVPKVAALEIAKVD